MFGDLYLFESVNEMIGIPTVLEQSTENVVAFDIISRLLKDRVIFLTGDIDDATASVVVSELLFLDHDRPGEPITMYINSPGGFVSAGLSIFDTIYSISSPVNTVCTGMACSMAAVLLACGTGTRSILPHSKVMIHQPSGGAIGQESDIQIVAKELKKAKDVLTELLSKLTGKSLKVVARDCDRDHYMDASEAVAYGIVDGIIEPKWNHEKKQKKEKIVG